MPSVPGKLTLDLRADMMFRCLFDKNIDAVFICRFDGSIIDVNTSACSILDMSRDAICDAALQQLVHPYQGLLAALTCDVPSRLTDENLYLVKRDGTHIPVEFSFMSCGKDDEGVWFVVARDFTQHRQADEELKFRLEELQKLMDLTPVSILVAHDPDASYITVNKTGSQLYEVEPGANVSASIPGRSCPRLYYDSTGAPLDPSQLPMQQAIAMNSDVTDMELQVKMPSGREVTLLGSATPLRGCDGKVRGSIGAYIDVTERKRVEAALRESEERFRVAAAATGAAIFDIDVIKKEFRAVHGFHEMIGYEASQAYSYAWYKELIHPEDLCDFRKTYIQLLEKPSDQMSHIRIRTSSGQYIHTETHARSICDHSGRVTRVIGSLVDMTDAVKSQQALETLLASRSEFLATCSHELKTPLTVLLADIGLLQRMSSVLDEEMRNKFIASMTNQVKKLNRLVTDLLDITRIESGHLSISPVPTSMDQLVEKIVKDFAKTCATHSVIMDALVSAVCNVDETRFEQMLQNLMTNAIKYSDEGTNIRVSMMLAQDYVDISVHDEGCGIPEEDIARLFERYYRHPSTGVVSGLGIGLYVTSQLIALHGGHILVESKVNQGSKFTLRLPLQKREPSQ